MVTLNKIDGNNRNILRIVGLSTDEKPIDTIENMHITNGSTFKCIDTGETFIFDSENKKWFSETNQSGNNIDTQPILDEIDKINNKVGDLNTVLETRLAGGVADE